MYIFPFIEIFKNSGDYDWLFEACCWWSTFYTTDWEYFIAQHFEIILYDSGIDNMVFL